MNTVDPEEARPSSPAAVVVTLAEEAAYREVLDHGDPVVGADMFRRLADVHDGDGVAENLRAVFLSRVEQLRTLASSDQYHGTIVDILVEMGRRREAREYAEQVAQGLADLGRAEIVFCALRVGNDDHARWAEARLRLIAFVAALRAPDADIDTQNDIAPPGRSGAAVRPRIGLVVKTWRRLQPVIDALEDELRRRIDLRARVVDDIVGPVAAQAPSDGYGMCALALSLGDVARHLLEMRLTASSIRSLPSLIFDSDAEDPATDDWMDDRDGRERWIDDLRANMEFAAEITAATRALNILHTDGEVLHQVAVWAAGEGLLDGLSPERFAVSWMETYGTLGALVYAVQEIAVLSSQRDVAYGPVENLLAWAVAEGILDDKARDILRGLEPLPSGFTAM